MLSVNHDEREIFFLCIQRQGKIRKNKRRLRVLYAVTIAEKASLKRNGLRKKYPICSFCGSPLQSWQECKAQDTCTAKIQTTLHDT